MSNHERLPPAFPQPSEEDEESYIDRMIQKDREYEERDNTLPEKR